MFRKPIGAQVGTKVYTVRDDPMQIIMDLRNRYGRTAPNKKDDNEGKFNARWSPNEPIESYFDRLEDCYIFSIIAKVPYTFEQLIDKAIITIQCTGLYYQALLEWAGFNPVNQTWSQLKLHFQEAYEIHLASRVKEQRQPMDTSTTWRQWKTMTPSLPFRRVSTVCTWQTMQIMPASTRPSGIYALNW